MLSVQAENHNNNRYKDEIAGSRGTLFIADDVNARHFELWNIIEKFKVQHSVKEDQIATILFELLGNLIDSTTSGNLLMTGNVQDKEYMERGLADSNISKKNVEDLLSCYDHTNSTFTTTTIKADLTGNADTASDSSKVNGCIVDGTLEATSETKIPTHKLMTDQITTHANGTGNNKHIPAAGSTGEFLKHDGSWGTPPYRNITGTSGTSTTISASQKWVSTIESNLSTLDGRVETDVPPNALFTDTQRGITDSVGDSSSISASQKLAKSLQTAIDSKHLKESSWVTAKNGDKLTEGLYHIVCYASVSATGSNSAVAKATTPWGGNICSLDFSNTNYKPSAAGTYDAITWWATPDSPITLNISTSGTGSEAFIKYTKIIVG